MMSELLLSVSVPTSAKPRLLLRGLAGAQTEISIAVMAYNLKRIVKVLGATRLTQALSPA
jgi:hypothetical protein